MKKILLLALIFSFPFSVFNSVNGQKITTSFWGCAFGVSSEIVYNNLVEAGLEPIVSDDAIFLKSENIYSIPFQTIGFKFTASDAFYNIFGYNKFDNKQAATDNLNEALSKLRDLYPTLQTMSPTQGCLKLYAYADADSGEAFSLGLYKGNNAFFVRLNIFSDYLLKKK